MKKYYINYELELIKTKEEWLEYYNENIDKSEYKNFTEWIYDMKRCDLLSEINVIKHLVEDYNENTKQDVFVVCESEKNDDYTIYYMLADCNLRGSLEDIKENYKESFGKSMEL